MRQLTPSNAGTALVLVAAMGAGFASPAAAAANFSTVSRAAAFTDSYARICPQFLTKYCVLTRSGHRESVETNPCLARERGWRILHSGSCGR